MGLMLAEPGYHTRCFVEWEEYPRQAIIAAQRAGYFAPAPIWDDLTTFDGKPLRGAIDTILAGYPCQPFSAAGQRRGADDERHLWPEVARVIREVEPEWVFLENVAGHVSLGAETVLRELWDMGWTPAAGLFSAAETGAPHERLRWFCVAHARGTERQGQQRGQRDARGRQEPHGHTALSRGAGLFPPGPGDAAAWAAVLRSSPDMAPAAAARDLHAWARRLEADGREWWEAQAEPEFCRLVDGLADRSSRLRLLGNGVFPLAAAHAWRTLAVAHGLRPVDMGAAGGDAATATDDLAMRIAE